MALKFNLTVNEKDVDGFKLSVHADSEKELSVAKELTEKLIEKITKIEVNVNNYE